MNQRIWYISFIKIKNRPVYIKTWVEKGVISIKDLLNENGNWLTHVEFEKLFNLKSAIMTHNSIISAIPRLWKMYIKRNFVEKDVNIKSTFKKIISMKKVCKESYGIMMQTMTQQPENVFIKWENELGKDIDINESFENVYNATVSSELRNFQFKFIHRLLATNNVLFRWGIIDNGICTLCKHEVDSIGHLFWKCNVTQLFIYRFSQWLKNHSMSYNSVDQKSFFFGINNEHVFNLICIITKMYLYSCKLKDCKPYVSCLLDRIYSYHNIEKYIAKKNSTLNQFTRKWETITL